MSGINWIRYSIVRSHFKKFYKSLTLHTKIVLVVTALLITIPSALILILEYNNPQTMAGFTFPEKVMSSTFESIALRTAGFTTINYANITAGTQMLMMVVMFIGGSPGGTAGGIKTTTFAMLVIYMINMLKGRDNIVVLRSILPIVQLFVQWGYSLLILSLY